MDIMLKLTLPLDILTCKSPKKSNSLKLDINV